MNIRQHSFKLIGVTLAALAMNLGAVATSSAAVGVISKSDLTGAWRIALAGRTGCGITAMMADVTLNTQGTGTGTLQSHGDCGNSTVATTFTTVSMDPSGSGKANLSCGTGCGWELDIQVSADRSTFNIVDVNPINPGNFIAGSAVHK